MSAHSRIRRKMAKRLLLHGALKPSPEPILGLTNASQDSFVAVLDKERHSQRAENHVRGRFHPLGHASPPGPILAPVAGFPPGREQFTSWRTRLDGPQAKQRELLRRSSAGREAHVANRKYRSRVIALQAQSERAKRVSHALGAGRRGPRERACRGVRGAKPMKIGAPGRVPTCDPRLRRVSGVSPAASAG